MSPLRTVNVHRYVTPLREGGSLPAIVEGDDDFLYVLKFRGAGQGVKALLAELIGGELTRAAGLKVPELVFAEVDPAFGRTEPDEEIQDLLKASAGQNLALHYLSGAITYDPAVAPVEEELASRIVWLDALLMNVDRTARNTNLLMWQKELWLIDHGAALYFHHGSTEFGAQAARPFPQVKDHVLLRQASGLEVADTELRALLTPEVVTTITAQLPTEWLQTAFPEEDAEVMRTAYSDFLNERIRHSEPFLNEALHARAAAL
ncbi:aminotransferase class I and II [Flaviaesturariibacter aridisoli]|uniref:Aminotransferase class I and II n=1 Tax=Flaviaesturariibacter aridisoli TaxID=2545761 RepID=A0A4R4E229_9BACT|nr:aminotransferase class I and II [Flaviaesturariibacter aridisoli]